MGGYARAGKVLAVANASDRVALFLARNSDDRKRARRDRRERERQTWARVLVVAGSHDKTFFLVELGRARKQRGGMTVGPETEVHDVERNGGAHEGVVPVGAGVDHRMNRAWFRRVEEHAARHAFVRVFVVDGHNPVVAEVDVDHRPVDGDGTECFVTLLGQRAARKRNRAGRPLGNEPGEGARHVVDNPNLTGKIHVWHSSRSMDRTTVEVYENNVPDWIEHRRRPRPPSLDAFVARCPPGVRADVGCGPGWHSGFLGEPVVAFDASAAMASQVRSFAPDAWPLVADLEHLPFRNGALSGAWAHRSYMHIAAERLPMALRDLHMALEIDATVHIQVTSDRNHENEDERFPGRHFTWWPAARLRDVVEAAGFEIDAFVDDGEEWIDIEATRAFMLPDTVATGMRVLIVGLNPGLLTAERGIGFVRPGNRFWPAAVASGLVPRPLDPAGALREANVGMTNLVRRATRGADELSRDEYQAGVERLARLVTWLEPQVVCFVGVTGYRAAVDKRAQLGWQPDGFAGAAAYVMPNTSGLNAHAKPADFVNHLRAMQERAS